MRYLVVVAYQVQPDRRVDFFEIVKQETEALIENELQTNHVSSILDHNDPNRFLILKMFDNQAAYLEHQTGEILLAFIVAIQDMIVSGPQIVFEGTTLYTRDDFSIDEHSVDPISFLLKK